MVAVGPPASLAARTPDPRAVRVHLCGHTTGLGRVSSASYPNSGSTCNDISHCSVVRNLRRSDSDYTTPIPLHSASAERREDGVAPRRRYVWNH
jgi:hypothetical protein